MDFYIRNVFKPGLLPLVLLPCGTVLYNVYATMIFSKSEWRELFWCYTLTICTSYENLQQKENTPQQSLQSAITALIQ